MHTVRSTWCKCAGVLAGVMRPVLPAVEADCSGPGARVAPTSAGASSAGVSNVVRVTRCWASASASAHARDGVVERSTTLGRRKSLSSQSDVDSEGAEDADEMKPVAGITFARMLISCLAVDLL